MRLKPEWLKETVSKAKPRGRLARRAARSLVRAAMKEHRLKEMIS